jgi:hypothetical protein
MKRFRVLSVFLFLVYDSFCQCTGGLNAGGQLVNNGDFTGGNTGFNSVTNYSCTCGANQYCVTSNSNSKCDVYGVTGNGGAGNFLMIDSPWTGNNSGTGTDTYWKQTITLSANTNYDFSFYYHGFGVSFLGLSPAIVSIYIGGVQQGISINTGSLTGGWIKYNLNFNSGLLSGPVAFEVRPASLQASSSGWEIGLDDFSLTSCDAPMPIEIVSFNVSGQKVFLTTAGVEEGTKCTFYFEEDNGNLSVLNEQYCYSSGLWKVSVPLQQKRGEVWVCLKKMDEETCSQKISFEYNEIPISVELYSLQGVLLYTAVSEDKLNNYLGQLYSGVFLAKYQYSDHAESMPLRHVLK